MSEMLISLNTCLELLNLQWCVKVFTPYSKRLLAGGSRSALRIVLTERLISSVALRRIFSLVEASRAADGAIECDAVN